MQIAIFSIYTLPHTIYVYTFSYDETVAFMSTFREAVINKEYVLFLIFLK